MRPCQADPFTEHGNTNPCRILARASPRLFFLPEDLRQAKYWSLSSMFELCGEASRMSMVAAESHLRFGTQPALAPLWGSDSPTPQITLSLRPGGGQWTWPQTVRRPLLYQSPKPLPSGPSTDAPSRQLTPSDQTQRPLASSAGQLPIPAKALTSLVPLNHSMTTTGTACHDRDGVQPN